MCYIKYSSTWMGGYATYTIYKMDIRSEIPFDILYRITKSTSCHLA